MKHIQITFSLFPHNYSFMSVSLLFSSYANTKLWLIFWFISALSVIPHMKPVTESNRLYLWKYFLHLFWPQIAFPVQALITSCLISLFSVSHTFHFAFCCWTHHLRYCAYSVAWVIENWIDGCLLPYGVKFLVSFSRPSLSPHSNCLIFPSTSLLPQLAGHLWPWSVHVHTCLYTSPGFQDFPLLLLATSSIVWCSHHIHYFHGPSLVILLLFHTSVLN